MASIPGLLFITIGVLVSAASLYINISQKSNSMLLFAVIGGFLFLWGLIKYFFMERKEKKPAHDYGRAMPQHYAKR